MKRFSILVRELVVGPEYELCQVDANPFGMAEAARVQKEREQQRGACRSSEYASIRIRDNVAGTVTYVPEPPRPGERVNELSEDDEA